MAFRHCRLELLLRQTASLWCLSLARRYELFKDVIVGSGSFLVTVKLMNGTVPLPHNYSLSSDEAVVVDVSLNTTLDQIKVVINKCWATSTPNPGDAYSYIFMENRSARSPVFLLLLLLKTMMKAVVCSWSSSPQLLAERVHQSAQQREFQHVSRVCADLLLR